jgi:hypothetical protein
MNTITVIENHWGLPIENAIPSSVLIANPRYIKDFTFTCSEIVFNYKNFHLIFETYRTPVPLWMLSTASDRNNEDPDFGECIRLTVRTGKGIFVEGDKFESRFGPTEVCSVGNWGSVKGWSMLLQNGARQQHTGSQLKTFSMRIYFPECELICTLAEQGLLRLERVLSDVDGTEFRGHNT